jgi:hypothetical protein
MGVYWRTEFYGSVSAQPRILGTRDRVLDDADRARGTVFKTELMRIFSIPETEIRPDSYIVEYEWTTHTHPADAMETCRLPVI